MVLPIHPRRFASGRPEAFVSSSLLARYRAEGDAAFKSRSRRPKTSPARLSDVVINKIVNLRVELAAKGLDAGAHTIAWHLEHHHNLVVSPATI